MAKSVNDAVLDAAMDKIATCVNMNLCSGEPANFAGIAAVSLADVVLTAGDGNGDYVVGDGDTSGRKITVGQQASVTVDTTGTGTHISLDDGSTLLYVTTTVSQSVTSGNTVTVPAFDIEILDPA